MSLKMKRIYKLMQAIKVNHTVIIFTAVLLALFTTGCAEDTVLMPILNTLKVQDTDFTATTADLKGEITSLGNQKILEYGIEISKSIVFDPSTTKSYSTPADTGIYVVKFTDLTPNTQYYYKAYVLINTAQVYSQNNEKFTTKAK